MAHASEADEAGEAGEAGVSHGDGPAEFLTELGLFDAANRIVAALYVRGERDAAREQLETSHHAFYEDLEQRLAAAGAPAFHDEALNFAAALREGLSDETVAARLSVLLAAIDRARAGSGATPRERVLSLKYLLDVAAADYAGGVDQGEILSDHEYRDAWGFVETARAQARALADDADLALAQAGRDVLVQIERTQALFPDLMPASVSGDPAAMSIAAAWVEIVALRLD